MITLRDLSRHLGLSVTQVSRALNGHSDVSEETRARVLQAAKDLKYHPNLSARKLVTGRSGMVGLVLPGKPVSPGDSFFVQMVAGLSAYFSRRERQFVLHIADGSGDIVDAYRRLIDGGGLDGFILLSPMVDDSRVAYLRQRKVPFVIHGRTVPAPDYPFFDIDNETVGHTLTRLLIERGHRRIAFLNGPRRHTFVEWRRDGYLRALAESGIAADPDLHLADEMTEGFGMIGGLRLMTSGAPPTAVICGNTLILKGLIQTLGALGLEVPRDVSVVAHDDALPGLRAAGFDPAVTVTRSPLEMSWQPLAEILLGHMDGQPVDGLQIWGPVEVIERGSIAEIMG
ncbi:MAG: substrate-binding domain-containing protein [Rubellimicrobium sp.]|nr:substrate-binding domain-containing protein [Rubellimicrobium sp.]